MTFGGSQNKDAAALFLRDNILQNLVPPTVGQDAAEILQGTDKGCRSAGLGLQLIQEPFSLLLLRGASEELEFFRRVLFAAQVAEGADLKAFIPGTEEVDSVIAFVKLLPKVLVQIQLQKIFPVVSIVFVGENEGNQFLG